MLVPGIAERRRGQVVILDVAARRTLDGFELFPVVDQLWRQGDRRFLVNLSEVPSVISAEIGELVKVRSLVVPHDGRLGLVGLSDRVRTSLQITRLLESFEVFANEDVAVLSLAGSKPAA